MIIISAHKEGLTKEINAGRSATLVEVLLGIVGFDGEVIQTNGCLKDIKEQCYIIRMNKDCRFVRTEEIADNIFKAADTFDQESIGFINLESNPPRMGVIDCKTRQTTSFGVAMSKSEPPKEVAEGWVKMLEHYYFPYGELTVLDDLSKFQVVELDECADEPMDWMADEVDRKPLDMRFTGGEDSTVLPECSECSDKNECKPGELPCRKGDA